MKKKDKRECTVNGKLGMVINSYTHTMDVFLYKERKTMFGVKKTYVKLIPREKPHYNVNQIYLEFNA